MANYSSYSKSELQKKLEEAKAERKEIWAWMDKPKPYITSSVSLGNAVTGLMQSARLKKINRKIEEIEKELRRRK